MNFSEHKQTHKTQTHRVCFLPVDRSGGWSSNGCSVQNSTDNETTCACNHLTSFAILLVRLSKSILCCTWYVWLLLIRIMPPFQFVFLKGPLQDASNQSYPGPHPYLYYIYRLWSLCHLPVCHPPHLPGLWVSIESQKINDPHLSFLYYDCLPNSFCLSYPQQVA